MSLEESLSDSEEEVTVTGLKSVGREKESPGGLSFPEDVGVALAAALSLAGTRAARAFLSTSGLPFPIRALILPAPRLSADMAGAALAALGPLPAPLARETGASTLAAFAAFGTATSEEDGEPEAPRSVIGIRFILILFLFVLG